ncbi:hypothetical protein [Rickettsiales endosymbiont of Stachyamoeba lipophora]|uniref:hypothetical protein n=1 Tax=Rickettsiales endosymbiont of Stachyamoeba lipophora TaxID=2486578 RepID=UPI000F64E1AC|nr:hypothetical protein [Rickettsiales endosymbiont of Stachyamoeba lipophora]
MSNFTWNPDENNIGRQMLAKIGVNIPQVINNQNPILFDEQNEDDTKQRKLIKIALPNGDQLTFKSAENIFQVLKLIPTNYENLTDDNKQILKIRQKMAMSALESAIEHNANAAEPL